MRKTFVAPTTPYTVLGPSSLGKYPTQMHTLHHALCTNLLKYSGTFTQVFCIIHRVLVNSVIKQQEPSNHCKWVFNETSPTPWCHAMKTASAMVRQSDVPVKNNTANLQNHQSCPPRRQSAIPSHPAPRVIKGADCKRGGGGRPCLAEKPNHCLASQTVDENSSHVAVADFHTLHH